MSEHYIGLISGTSLDAIDAALLVHDDATPRLVAARNHPLPTELRQALLALCQPGADEIRRLGQADTWLGEVLAEAALALLREADVAPAAVRAIGSHGQTVRHLPRDPHGFTLQLGDPNRIAERTGITTVADFRRRDLAAGGEGAPLVPAFHARVFTHATRGRIILNLGGIANITVLPVAPAQPVTGFDTGPANGLLDAWVQQQRQLPYDRDGAWAASGRVQAALLAQCLADDYFQLAPPKSSGREYFNLAWLERHLAALPVRPAAEDVQATLCELTAASVAMAIERFVPAGGTGDWEVYVCGGGSHNTELMARLTARLAPLPLLSTAALGIAPDWVEACAFAWLARETLAGRPGNLPAVTGAARPVILGGIYPAG